MVVPPFVGLAWANRHNIPVGALAVAGRFAAAADRSDPVAAEAPSHDFVPVVSEAVERIARDVGVVDLASGVVEVHPPLAADAPVRAGAPIGRRDAGRPPRLLV